MDSLARHLGSLSEPAQRAGAGTSQLLEHALTFLAGDLAALQERLAAWVSGGTAPGSLAASHLLKAGGKHIRPLLVLLSYRGFAHFQGEPRCRSAESEEVARDLACVAELVHMATLMHDDVVDDAAERRGVPVARRLWGNAVSVLAGDLLLVRSLEAARVASESTYTGLLATLRALVEGEIVQLRGRTQLDLSEATYNEVIEKKTASLFRWAARTGAMLGGANDASVERMSAFGREVGMAFQLLDDVLDYEGEGTGKTLAADVSEGKVTLPLSLAIVKDPALLVRVERLRAGDVHLAGEIAVRVRELSVTAIVRERARAHTTRAIQLMDACGAENSPGLMLLRGVAEELAQRSA